MLNGRFETRVVANTTSPSVVVVVVVVAAGASGTLASGTVDGVQRYIRRGYGDNSRLVIIIATVRIQHACGTTVDRLMGAASDVVEEAR